MTNDDLSPNDETRTGSACFQRTVTDILCNYIGERFVIRPSSFLRHSAFVLRH
jgi:hypothetical protein